jgi:hypothetical protein
MYTIFSINLVSHVTFRSSGTDILKHYIVKEYLKLLNRIYDITWFGSVYA